MNLYRWDRYKMKRLFIVLTLIMALGLVFSFAACSSEPEVIVEEKIVEVEKEVIKEVEVPSDPEIIIEEKIVEVEVEKEVIKEVEVPSEPKVIIEEKEVIKEVEVPSDPGKLVVYSGRKESLVGPIIEQFKEATGIEVEVKYGSTGEIAATLMEEGMNTPADVFFAQDPGGLGAIANAGMFSKLSADILGLAPDWAQSPEGLWVGISGRARTLVYSTADLDSADLPDTLQGLTDPKWKGKIGWAPTNGSFQAMVTAMRVLWGEEETKTWLQAIQDNEAQVYPKNTPQVAAAAEGEILVGLVNHYYLHRFLSEEGDEFGARNHHLPGGGPGSLVMVAGGGILSTAKNQDNAEKFFKFMLSTVAQQYFAGQTYEYPLVEGVKTNRILTPMEEINKPDIDMAQLEDLAGTQTMLRDLGILE